MGDISGCKAQGALSSTIYGCSFSPMPQILHQPKSVNFNSTLDSHFLEAGAQGLSVSVIIILISACN